MSVDISHATTAYVPIGNDSDEVIVENDSFEREFIYEEQAKPHNPISFSGYVATGQVRDSAGTLVDTLTVTLALGLVTVELATLPAAGIYSYDIEITAGAIKKTIQRGPFQVTAEVTQ